MALLVKHVGQYGPHAAAKKAGFRPNDVIVEFDGQNNLFTDTDFLVYGVTHCRPGEKVATKILRGGKEMMLKLPMQK